MPKAIKKSSSGRDVSKEEVDKTLQKIFDSVDQAIKAKKARKLTLEGVDKTLYALFDTVNRVHTEGKNVELPDFRKILESAEA